MNLYRIFSNGLLSHKEKSGVINSSDTDVFRHEDLKSEISFSSDEIVPIIESGVLDTEDPMLIAKYKSNLNVLKEKALRDGSIHEFLMIREDDIFPYDWMWRVNSNQTAREYAKSNFAYSLRMAEARYRVTGEKKAKLSPQGFAIPGKVSEENYIASSLDPQFGEVYEPTKFRSTKHFTINTALAYTGTYNQVSNNRNYVVIDKPDLFCQSGYGYSADYQDAYLDVTHESLAISEDAIILINEAKYPNIIKDDTIKEQLDKRKVILYRGDEATAINMVLSQEGVLPYRPGGKYMDYDQTLENIMIQSMQKFCKDNNLDYAQNHGNMFGQGGHFSDRFDSEDDSRLLFEKEFILFMQHALPDYKDMIDSSFYKNSEKIIPYVDYSKVLEALHKYNEWAHKDEISKRLLYDNDRRKITPEIHLLFVDTLRMIQDYFSSHEVVEDSLLHQNMLMFFHSFSIDEQVEAAKKIKSILLEDIKQY